MISMILHSTLPYRQDIPNPALGYLKGFLQEKGIAVNNVYWNIILARAVIDFHRNLEKYTKDVGLSSIPAITLFLCKHLLTEGSQKPKTTLDLLFSSVVPEREISDMVTSVKNHIEQYIQQNNLHKSSLSGFTLKTYQWPMDYYLICRLKALNPDMKVVIGGITNESQGLSFMKVFTLADYAVWGEGEYPLFYLSRALEEGTPVEKVPNLIYRQDGGISSTKKMTYENVDLDSYPFADHTDYFTTFSRYIPVPMTTLIPIWGSRSCPWNRCRFCVLNEEYHYRVRSPENVVREVEYQLNRHKVDNFIFVDTELPGNKKRFETLLHLLVESSSARKRPYHLYAEISPVFITAETARLMQLASFSSIQIGFEAMTDTLLEKMEKKHRFAHNLQALKLGNQYDLKMTGLNIIREIPTETGEDIKESCTNLRFLRFLLHAYPLSLIFLMLFKGAPFYNDVSDAEKEYWKGDPFWEEIAPSRLVSEADRFELFGFCRDSPTHYNLWTTFETVLNSYLQQSRSYKWLEYSDGSFVEETGPKTLRYTFNRDETDILLFCDVIRSFSEVKERFSHIPEEKLREILRTLKNVGLLYYDAGLTTIISILEAARRNVIPNVRRDSGGKGEQT